MDENTKAELYKMYARAMKMMPGSSQQKELVKKIGALRKKLGMNEERDYKAEYKKFQSSTKSKKYRAELNKYNRKKGTYGNGDGKDASHKGGKIVGFEKESTNRGRAEKSRLKKESTLNENPAAMAAAQAMVKIKMKNPKTGKENSAVSALKDKDNPNHKKAKGIFAKLKDRFSKKKDDKKAAPTKQTKSDADFYKRQYTGESVDEGTTQKFKSAIIDKAIKVAKSMGGNMTAAVKKIEKMEKGLSKNGRVEYALQQANESVNEVKLSEDYKNSEWEVYVADENGKEKIVKKAKSKRAGVILYNKLINSDKYHEVGMRVVKESVNEAKTQSIDGEELLDYLQKRFKMSRKQAIASMKKHNMDVSSIKKESVNESTKKVYNDLYVNMEKAYEKFAREVVHLAQASVKLVGGQTDKKIIIKHFHKNVLGFMKLMMSWNRGHQSNPHIDESDLPITTKKGKTIKVTHKKSGKELVVVDKPAVIKKYAKLGFYAESVNEAKSKTMTTIGSIIGKKQAQKISGVLVDMQTALVIMKVWNALGSSNRAKFEKLPIKKMANVAWKLMK